MDNSKLKPTCLNITTEDEQDQPTNQQAIGIKPKINSKQNKEKNKSTKNPCANEQKNLRPSRIQTRNKKHTPIIQELRKIGHHINPTRE